MSKDDEGFIRRWSRLKQRDESAPDSPSAESKEVPVVPAQTSDADKAAGGAKEEEIDLSKLPSIESLVKDSDYSVFMRKGVPDDLRRQALRRLYQTNPDLAGPDLLEMNAFDYTYTDGIRPLVNPGLGSIVQAVQKAIDSGDDSPPVATTATEKPTTESETASKAPGQPKADEEPNRG